MIHEDPDCDGRLQRLSRADLLPNKDKPAHKP